MRLEQRVAELLQRFQDEDFQWDGLSANQLCNQQPAIVARQFQHQLRQFLRWLASQIAADNEADILAEARNDEEEDAASVAAPATDQGGKHHSMPKERPPFQVTDYIVRIEWQKRGYPHARILLWAKMPTATTGKALGKGEAEDADWSDEEARHKFVPTRAEELSDKFICTKSPGRWLKSEKIDPDKREVNAKLARLVEHRCSAYCGRFTLGSCRFGFPHTAEPRTRLRTAQEQFASRWKSSLATRRHEDDTMMGQYNIEMLRQWRASMDLQVICEVTSASRYILGYAFKSEEDFAAARRMEAIIEQLTALAAGSNLNHQQVYKAAHTALQGRTTSVFEACHLLLVGFAVVEFSRDNVWVQVGPPHTWTLWVPQQDESRAFEQPEAYYQAKQGNAGAMPVAQRVYQQMQTAFPDQEVEVPVEKGAPVLVPWKMVTFFDFCAGFRYISVGKEPPKPRRRPAIVGYRNFSPDLEPESFYYSKLLLHVTWKEPGDWLREADDGSHAAAFQRIAQDTANYPTFLQSICMPELDGTVEAARKLQAVQANMYMKAKLAPDQLRDGWAHSRADASNYRDALHIMEALKERHGADIDFLAPDTVPTGPATSFFAPVEGGEEAFNLLQATDPTPETTRQRQAMEYIIRAVTDQPHTKDSASLQRIRILLHGPGGCGKSVVVRAAAHMLQGSRDCGADGRGGLEHQRRDPAPVLLPACREQEPRQGLRRPLAQRVAAGCLAGSVGADQCALRGRDQLHLGLHVGPPGSAPMPCEGHTPRAVWRASRGLLRRPLPASASRRPTSARSPAS